MRHAFGLLLTAFLLVTCSGCLPNGMIAWSPDGRQAAIVSDGKLVVTDTQGKLIHPGVENVRTVAWMGDELLVFLNVELETWAELVRALGPKEAAVIEADARRALALAKARGRAYVEARSAGILGNDGVHAANIVFCLWWRHREEVEALMDEEADEGGAADGDDSPTGRAVRLRRIKLIDGKVGDSQAVWTLGQDVWAPAVHPTGKWVAWHGGGGLMSGGFGVSGGEVTIASTSRAKPIYRAAVSARGRLAWVDNGRSLLCVSGVSGVYSVDEAMREDHDETAALPGRMAQVNVLRHLLADGPGPLAPDQVELVEGPVVIPGGYQPLTRVGGKLILQTWKMSLRCDPGLEIADPSRPGLHVVTVGEQGPQLAPMALPDAVFGDGDAMVVLPSPDGSLLAKVAAGELTILDAANGRKLHEDGGFLMPVRGSWIHFRAGKAYYVARRPSEGEQASRIALICWDGQETRELSARWPDGLLGGFVSDTLARMAASGEGEAGGADQQDKP